MGAELAQWDGEEALRTAVRTHLASGPLHSLNVSLLDAATDAVLGVLAGSLPADDRLETLVRSFHDDARLAASRYASGDQVGDRANAARMRIRQAVASRFGDSGPERLMYAALEHGYLDPTGGHASAERALHLSRATYFRVLRRARDRLG